jgi:hypothetical protein
MQLDMRKYRKLEFAVIMQISNSSSALMAYESGH